MNNLKVIKENAEIKIMLKLENMIEEAIIAGQSYVIIPNRWVEGDFPHVKEEMSVLDIAYDEKMMAYRLNF